MSSDGRSTTAIDAPPSSVRVLIAEDDADVRDALSRGLTACGHIVVGEAATMSDAIERTRELVPDVLLLDAHLGPTRIVEAAKTLAHDNPGIAVIFLCGEPTFALEGDVAGTTAISVLPSSCPTSRARLEHQARRASARASCNSAREEVAEVRQSARESQGDRAREGHPHAPHRPLGAGSVSHPPAHEPGSIGADGGRCQGSPRQRAGALGAISVVPGNCSQSVRGRR